MVIVAAAAQEAVIVAAGKVLAVIQVQQEILQVVVERMARAENSKPVNADGTA